MIYLVLSFDCINHNDSVSVVFEKHNQITEELIPLSCLVDIISKLKVEFLVLVGKDSQLVGKYLSTNSSASKRKKPLVILTVESEFYALKNYLSQ